MNYLIKVIIAVLSILSVMSCFALSSLEKKNKSIVLAFYNDVVNKKDFNLAKPYLGKEYRQHNPKVPDGPKGLKQFIQYLKRQYPYAHSNIKQIFTDNNYVILHVHSIKIPKTPGQAIVDIFLLKKGKIIEHWDVIQNIPEKSANHNTMF